MKHFRIRLTVLAATLASVPLASANILVLGVNDNSTIRASAGNQGTSQILFVGDTTTADDYLRSAVAFDLNDPLLIGATINSATLTFTVRGSDSSSADATITLDLHQLTSSFTNDGVTWTSRDGTNNWSTGGGDFGGILASNSGNPATAATNDTLDFSGANLVGAVQGAIGGNIYLLLKSASEDNTARNLFQFASTRNVINSAPGPKLTIDYTTPLDTTPPEILPPTVPADGDTGVPVSTSLGATFSEPIALENGGTITIDVLGGTDTAITLPDSQVSVSGSDLVITPASPLAAGTDYAIRISHNAVKDLAPTPNFFIGISDTTTWNFQTAAADTTAPVIIDLSPPDEGAVVASGSLVATFDEKIVAVAPTAVLNEDFEGGGDGFTVMTTAGSGWSRGTPDSVSPGGTIDSGNGAASGSGNCWGTNLGAYAGGTGDPGYYAVPTTTCLRSAPIDLTGVTSPQLSFAQAFDLFDPDDEAIVNIIDDTTDTIIAPAVYTVPNGSSGWASSPTIDLSAGIGQIVRIEWCLTGTGGGSDDYLGWYVDDVAVTASTSGGITLKNLTDSTETQIALYDPAVAIVGTSLTLTPAAALEVGKRYAVQIAADALTDFSGNPFGGILDDSFWNFTVEKTLVSAFDTRADTNSALPLDQTSTTDLAIGPVSIGRYFRSYLTFDLSGASPAAGDTTLVLSPAGVENNTSSVPQTLTLFVLGADWNGATQPWPDGTAVATINFTPRTSGDDNRGISFSSAALTTAFNNALGGNLYLGIKSDAEGADARSFLWLAGAEEPDFTGYEPRLNYTLATGEGTFADWITGKPGVNGKTGLNDDPDGDGIDNGVENFFGTEPGEFSVGLVAGTVNPVAGTFTFTHPQGSLAGDLTRRYRWSTDLATFHDDGASSGGTTVNFSTLPDPPEAGTPTTVTATVTGAPVQKLFVRVEVTQN